MGKDLNILWVTNGLPTENHPEYCIFTKDQIDQVKQEGVRGKIYFINAREKGISEYVRAFFSIRKLVKKHDFDLIHCFHGLSYLLTLSLFLKKPILVSFLNAIENEYNETNSIISSVLIGITNLSLKLNTQIGVILKDKIPDYLLNRENTFHLPNGVDTNIYYPIDKAAAKNKIHLQKDKKYILFVSSKNIYRPQKRYDRFKEVLRILKSEYSQINLRELKISNVRRDQLIYFYNAVELHLLTSDFEGSPNSVKEAIACNTPVVSTDVGNVKDMLKDIPNCKVSSKKNPIELAKLVDEVLRAPKTEIRMNIFNKNLDSKSKSRQLKELYFKLIT